MGAINNHERLSAVSTKQAKPTQLSLALELQRLLQAVVCSIVAMSKVCGCAARRSTAQHGAARRSTAQHGAARRSTAQHGAARRSTAQHGAARRSTAQHGAARHSTAQCALGTACTMQCTFLFFKILTRTYACQMCAELATELELGKVGEDPDQEIQFTYDIYSVCLQKRSL